MGILYSILGHVFGVLLNALIIFYCLDFQLQSIVTNAMNT
jgi:hypothetical protein